MSISCENRLLPLGINPEFLTLGVYVFVNKLGSESVLIFDSGILIGIALAILVVGFGLLLPLNALICSLIFSFDCSNVSSANKI